MRPYVFRSVAVVYFLGTSIAINFFLQLPRIFLFVRALVETHGRVLVETHGRASLHQLPLHIFSIHQNRCEESRLYRRRICGNIIRADET